MHDVNAQQGFRSAVLGLVIFRFVGRGFSRDITEALPSGFSR